MIELAIKRALNESTRKQGIYVGKPGQGKVYSLHITKNREAIITDDKDYSRVYAVLSLDFYNQVKREVF